MSTATVVGAGPNGLAAAVALARAGLRVTVLEAAERIGGGTRSGEAIVPGLLHDHCSAIHPMAVGSPFLSGLGLDRYGLRWAWPEIDCVHPLDGGTAGVLHRSVAETAAGLGADGRTWRRLFQGPSAAYDSFGDDIMGPLLRLPRHPVRLARFGIPALAPAALLAKAFRTEEARGLWGGVAAHAFHPLERPLTASVGLGIVTAGHCYGWAVAEGGSRRITDALAALLRELGGTIETGVRVRSVAQLPHTELTLWDLAPTALADILGDLLPPRIARAYRRYRYGPGAFKVDFAIEGGVPWQAGAARRAGTVHVGGTYAEIAATERDIHAGRMPQRPFVLVGQQYLADPSRSTGDVHPVWSYAHVPNGYTGDATAAIIAQIERFAPGFRDRIVGTAVRTTPGFAEYNPNYVGGNIMTGATDAARLVLGARPTLQPYDTGVPGHYLCSAATPPGAGAHGMCGAHAAERALRRLRA
ncbi:NAD(P)/FAD-dependent oxidoreductase [Streptomyces coacervatus]|uniref:phytoene desaturase family protein n=1 Tax=Streptomyces coacervatus TaxID=647381 RepID=UPI0023DB4A20|nr:NAD(P)/FAD-dependent oxidoreductase [Streptomyces coacervatus]MDF2268525.1 NAD(P)/FAD-dependent oxidoreductase [Streptomyces coacervatus]